MPSLRPYGVSLENESVILESFSFDTGRLYDSSVLLALITELVSLLLENNSKFEHLNSLLCASRKNWYNLQRCFCFLLHKHDHLRRCGDNGQPEEPING